MTGGCSKRLTTGNFRKIYHTADLLDPGWEARVAAIEELSSLHLLIPKITFERGDNGELIYCQQWIRKVQPAKESLLSALERFALDFEQIAASGFVHGDISFKNLLFDGQAYRLIDLEPSLRQRRKGRQTLLYTPPYIALSDFRHDRLTLATDKVGFYFFCRRMLNPIAVFSPLHEMRRIQAGHCIMHRFTGMDEKTFCRQPYRDLLHCAATAGER